VEQAHARPPLLEQVPRNVWTALLWAAALLYAAAVCFGRVFDRLPNGRPLGPHLTDIEWITLALVLAAPVGVALRRPMAVFGVLVAESAAAVVFARTPWQWLLVLAALDPLLLYIAAVRPRRTSIPSAVLALSAEVVEICCSNMPGTPPLLICAVPLASVILAAWSIGNSVRQRRAYAEALRVQAAAQAVTAERLRIARELHDQVAHSIGVIAIQAGAAGLVLDARPERAREALAAIETTSRETLAGLRRMLVSLRRLEAEGPTAPEPAAGLEALARLAERTAGAGIEVQVEWHGACRPLPPEVDLAAFRIIQEAVTNVARHSAARRCQVHLAFRPTELAIDVLDDGRGAPQDTAARNPAGTAGLGITGMRERAALLGGRLSAGPRPEGGFRVTARLPG
jgi:signal transduction histidine kinase